MDTIKFGNIKIEQFEKRVKTKFNEEDKKWLIEHRTDSANGEKGKFHICDLPFDIEACETIVGELITILSKYNEEKTFAENVRVISVKI